MWCDVRDCLLTRYYCLRPVFQSVRWLKCDHRRANVQNMQTRLGASLFLGVSQRLAWGRGLEAARVLFECESCMGARLARGRGLETG